jgi:hypothetical protein
LIAFSGVFQRWEFKNTTKPFYKTNRVEKFLQKIDQKSFFSRILFHHVFGRFSARRVQKHEQTNVEKINVTLVLFRTLTHPPTTGVTENQNCRPPLGAVRLSGGPPSPRPLPNPGPLLPRVPGAACRLQLNSQEQNSHSNSEISQSVKQTS